MVRKAKGRSLAMRNEQTITVRVGEFENKFSTETSVLDDRFTTDKTTFIIANRDVPAARWERIGKKLRGNFVPTSDSAG